MSVINATPLLAAAGGDYQISRSVRLRSSASAYFNRTPGSAGNRKTWTWSGWVKRGTLGVVSRLFAADDGSASTDQDYNTLLFNSSNQLQFSGNLTDFRVTTAVYRDPSAWYHIVFTTDTTQATAANRFKLYVNGLEVTAFGTSNNPSQNTDLAVNASIGHYIGSIAGASYLDGYLTEINFIDGQALTPSSFGETDAITGVWKPKKYAGTYGTNGFYLNFSDNSSNTATTIGKDNSGNGNNWTPNNISVTAGSTYDSMIDVPTLYADGGNGRGNYCTLNPLGYKPSATTITQANLRVTTNTSSAFGAVGSIAVDSGKWYWEATFAGGQYMVVGISSATTPITTDTLVGGTATSYGYYSGNGQKVNNNSGVSYGATYTTNDVIGVALDLDAGTLTFYKNGTTQGTAFTSLSGLFTPAFSDVDTPSGACDIAVNFGQRPFAYTPPTGFKALNTQNLPAPTILKGNQYFDVSLWTGNSSTQSITNSGSMQPDFVWIKKRNASDDHGVFDAVRGVQKRLQTNLTNAENTETTALSSFDSGGFTLGSNGQFNGSTFTYAGWQWKESASAGFDIVTYTGTGSAQTISHSLGVAPKMIIAKNRGGTSSWAVYHASIGAGNAMYLNLTQASAVTTNWNSTAPTSSVFSVGTAGEANPSGGNLVAYLFAEVAGFSKFGSYTGNGSADGPFVFTGFRPRYVMIKRTDSTGDWFVFDTARNTFNTMSSFLRPNWSDAEATNTNHSIDLLSNGFKSRAVDTGVNASGGTFIYAAFSEHPFKNSLAR